MSKGRLYYMIGLSRSGKSTVCDKWLDYTTSVIDNRMAAPRGGGLADDIRHRVVVETDAIRKAITGDRWNGRAESQVYAIKHAMIATLLEQGYDVLVDGTHTSEVSMTRMLELDVHAEFCLHDTSLGQAVDNARKSGQSDLVNVIYRHSNNLMDGNKVLRGSDLVRHLQKRQRYHRAEVVVRAEYSKRV